MKMTQVRNATAVLESGGKTVLIDPMLSAKGAMEAFPSNTGDTARNPLVDLAVPLADLLSPDIVVVTHTHTDHWDSAAASLLPRDVPVLVQHAADAELITNDGFTDVRILDEPITIDGLAFNRTEGRHGTHAALEAVPSLGQVMGVVVSHPEEPAVYFAGDTVLTEDVRAALEQHTPDVVVLNTGGAVLATGEEEFPTTGPILMEAQDVFEVYQLAPQARVVAVHMEALNHCPVTRADVRSLAADRGISESVLVPEDGDVLNF
ncbi:MBL fold metallo-hydrolase [Nocardiopsis xinjiangensis]|uniref:MBL fold metallo-hydrolase n=1 Tax=Nocardiopsis xinjiangensis TaxID=124285 RepID=UPI000346AF85|nr:MBL fold metallo-hydrolase [Nocardiopsis xinjiangensis]